MPELDHSLINPNQLTHFGIHVQDDPYATLPIAVIDHDRQFTICLKSIGTTIYIDTWKPAHEDPKSHPHMILTSDQSWEPILIKFPQKDESEMEKIEKRNISRVQVSENSEYLINNQGYNPANITHALNQFIIPIYLTISSIKSDLNVVKEEEMKCGKMFMSGEWHSNITPEDLSERCRISVKQAQLTLKVTTTKFKRSTIMPIARSYHIDHIFQVRRLTYIVSCDTMDARLQSIHENRNLQVFATKKYFVEVYPLKRKSDCHEALDRFVKDYGAPRMMIFDRSLEQGGRYTKLSTLRKKYDISKKITEPDRPSQNPEEGVIRELHKKWYREICHTNCPIEYRYKYAAQVMCRTLSYSGRLGGMTSIELIIVLIYQSTWILVYKTGCGMKKMQELAKKNWQDS